LARQWFAPSLAAEAAIADDVPMNVLPDESFPPPGAALDEILEASREALKPYRDRLVATRAEDWVLTASGHYRKHPDGRFFAFGTVDVNGRPATSDDRNVEACLTVEERGSDVLVDAWTHSWLDVDEMQSGGYCVGERVGPLAEARSAMLSFIPSLMEHLDQILARLDSGERDAVQ
jgi:hypothetical protein